MERCAWLSTGLLIRSVVLLGLAIVAWQAVLLTEGNLLFLGPTLILMFLLFAVGISFTCEFCQWAMTAGTHVVDHFLHPVENAADIRQPQ